MLPAAWLPADGAPVREFNCGTGPLQDEIAASEPAQTLSDGLFPLIAAADAFVRRTLREPFGIAPAMARSGADHLAENFIIESCARRWNAICAAVHQGKTPCAA